MVAARKQLEHMFALAAAVVLLPVLTLIACVVLAQLNSDAGYQRYKLPEFAFALYLVALVLGPAVGAGVLVTVAARRATLLYVPSDADAKVRDRAVVAAMLAVLLDGIWVVLVPYVFFSAGGSR